ncbi:hypothetical protein M3B43_03895 [Nesterenkonia massiliensis]|uniref:Uncharacterized protein n=2 Tax=Nesterenkonia TaxID=57494 RepID=A0ABP9FRZ0_9MICC|nr:hypothetical protein [Nesterenkonia massiliensis]MCT1606481.1 hypothetical protein [Nesterenkonia massiliensis]
MTTPENPRPETEAQLEQVLRETEAAVADLRQELDRIQSERLQRAEVDRLEEHLATATVRWSVVKEFLKVMVQELRGAQNSSPGQQSNGTDPKHDLEGA